MSAFDQFNRNLLKGYHRGMTEEAQKSLRLLQQGIVQLTRLRDKHPDDLELGQLIWDNIATTTACIQQELRILADHRRAHAETGA